MQRVAPDLFDDDHDIASHLPQALIAHFFEHNVVPIPHSGGHLYSERLSGSARVRFRFHGQGPVSTW